MTTRLTTRLIFAGLFTFGTAVAEPSFAYKYKVNCTFCHTVYPRLNRTGYEFRRLGYRLPNEVNKSLASAPAPSSPPPSAANPGDATAGRQLYSESGCAACHRAEGRGGEAAPALDGVGSRRSPEYIATQITRPRDHDPSSIMPAFSLTGDQIRQLTAFLETLPDGNSAKRPSEYNPLNYLGLTWIPAIRLNASEANTSAGYDTRTMILFLAGTVGDHFSLFVESNPASAQRGFANKLDVAQGVLNFGGSENFTKLRFGQILTLQGDGFGGTDRFYSDSLPLIYLPVNGFAAARFGRGGSAEYTLGMSTTFKAFGVEESDGSRAFGGVLEKLIGSQGLSGVSLEMAAGWNPNTNVSFGREFHFQRWYLSGNKTFQNKQGTQRANLIAGLSVLNDNRVAGGEFTRASRGYGSFVQAESFFFRQRVSPYIRFDQLRPSTVTSSSEKAGTVGCAFDVTKFTRLLLEYQRFASGRPFNFITIGFRLNL